MPHARGTVILTLQNATASLTPAYPPPPPCPAGCCASLQIALKVNRARVVFVHLAQQLLHVLLPRASGQRAGRRQVARGGERGYRACWRLDGGGRLQEWRPSGSKSRRPTAASVACYPQPEPRTAPATEPRAGTIQACRAPEGQPGCATLFHTRRGTFLGSQPSARMTTQRSSVSIVPVPSLSNRSNESWISLSWSSFSSFFLR